MSATAALPRTETAQRPARLERMARAFAVLFLEVEAGLRPRQQLRRLIDAELYARLDGAWILDGDPAGRLLGLHGRAVAPGRYEVVALVARGRRVTALAFRLRRGAAGWQVDELCRPERGPLPDPAYPVPRDEPDLFDLLGA